MCQEFIEMRSWITCKTFCTTLWFLVVNCNNFYWERVRLPHDRTPLHRMHTRTHTYCQSAHTDTRPQTLTMTFQKFKKTPDPRPETCQPTIKKKLQQKIYLFQLIKLVEGLYGSVTSGKILLLDVGIKKFEMESFSF